MIAIKGGTIRTITNGIIRSGIILVNNGKIEAIGNNLPIPENAQVIDASKLEVMPGMVEAHGHAGVLVEGMGQEGSDGNEMTNPFTPHMRVIDAIDPFDNTFREILQVGITTMLVCPGSGNTVGGQCSVIRTKGSTVEEMLILQEGGMKFALGENPKRVYGTQNKEPMTRMGIAAIIREGLYKAKEYLKKKSEAEKDPEKKLPDVNLKFEALAGVLSGRAKARFHAHKAHDIITAIRIAEEFGLDMTLEHCTEGTKVIHVLAEKKIPVVLSPLMDPRTKVETRERSLEIAGKLANEGIPVSISTDAISVRTKWLPINAGLCVRYGMKEEDAFNAITINPARVIGVESRKGSLEAGKDADILITDGHPLETRTRTAAVLLEGEIVHFSDEILKGKGKV